MTLPTDMHKIEQQFYDFLSSHGHPLDGQIIHDSKNFQYLKCPHGNKTDARYKFFSDGIPAGYLKCWHCGIDVIFCSKQKHEVSKEAWIEHQEYIRKLQQDEEVETKKRQKGVAEIAQSLFSQASEPDAINHGYLQLKRVKNYGLRVILSENSLTKEAKCYKNTLLVPCFDINENLVNLERIYFDKTLNKYVKRPLKNGLRNGTYYLVGLITQNQDTILITEGIATAFTAYEATNIPTVAAFTCGNIPAVIKGIRKKYPDKKLLIIADDDKWHTDEKLRDSGLKSAKKACIETEGVNYILPDFSILNLNDEELQKLQLTDINDLFVALLSGDKGESEALSLICEQIELQNSEKHSITHAEILTALLDKVVKVNFRQLAELTEEETLKDSQIQVIAIDEILKLAKENNWGLCKKHDFVYLFNGEYWVLLEDEDLKAFLGNAAKKMGLRNVHAQHFNFKDKLHKQFIAAAYLPEPNQPQDVININLKNGTFEINPFGNKLKPFNRNDFLTYQLPFQYDPVAKAPIFEAYLNRVLPDKKLQSILAEYLGYVFIRTSTLKLEKTLLLYGSGANGKSVFYEIVRSLLGEQNTSEFSLQSLTNENGYYRAMIANKLVNYASEINGKLETSIFKQLVSGEPVEARLPYGRPFVIREYAKFIFNCNELPRDVEQTNAYFRRFLIVPFEQTIPEKEQDKQLAQKIVINELSGVFNWVLEGLERLLKQKQFTESEAVIKAREKYEKESDTVKLFLEEYDYVPHSMHSIQLKRLYSEYRTFCTDDGFIPVNKTNFQKRLENCKVVIEKRNIGKVVFVSNESEYKQYT
ncbi:TPA: hypothetical protein KLD42_002832 [Legionella pneumophila]|nr:hypothetical protein [Legionella pneumophila]